MISCRAGMSAPTTQSAMMKSPAIAASITSLLWQLEPMPHGLCNETRRSSTVNVSLPAGEGGETTGEIARSMNSQDDVHLIFIGV